MKRVKALLVAGGLHLARLARWAGDRTGAESLLWILHIGYLFLPLGAVTLAASILVPGLFGGAAAQHLWMAGAAGTELSRGGMITKIEAGKIATASGTAMIIASGKKLNPVSAIAAGEASTWFKPSGNPVTARKRWISGQLGETGTVAVDDGALKALNSGKSLLPAGVVRVEGNFSRGDIVSVCDTSGTAIGRGIVAYDASDAARIAGCKSGRITEILGYDGRSEMIHRDDLVIFASGAREKVEGHA